MSEQKFELKTWADADVTIGPGNPAHPDHGAWLEQQEESKKQGVEPKTEENKS